LIFLGFKIGQRWLEAVMHCWGSYFVPVPKRHDYLWRRSVMAKLKVNPGKKESVGERIARLRNERGSSQRDLAREFPA